MFHPLAHPLERGWVGRIDGDRVVHLAAQTLQSFFTGGGSAREHAEYALADVRLLAPILHPPSVRLFDDESSFAFANPAAIVGPGTEIPRHAATTPSDTASPGRLTLLPRLAAVIGAEGTLAAFTILAEWRDPARPVPKDRDFALGLGPVAVTAPFAVDGCALAVRVDGAEPCHGTLDDFDVDAAVALAGEDTRLYAGDLVASPSVCELAGVGSGSDVEIEIDGIGILAQRVAG